MMALDPVPLVRAFLPLFSVNSVGCVIIVGSGVYVPTGIESVGEVVQLVVFVPR